MSEKTLVSSRFLSALCFLILAAYSFLLARSGLDVTDTGFNLYQQQLTLKGQSQSTALWFSDFIGGLWQSLFSSMGLLGAGLGWCFLMLLFALLTTGFLKRWMGLAGASLVTLFLGFTLIGGRLEILYYTNLGVFFLSGGALCYLKFRESPQWKWVTLYALLAGITFGCRFPSVLGFFCFPLIPIVLDLLFVGKLRGLKKLFTLWGASLVGVGLFLGLTALSGLWENYVHSFQVMLGLVQDVPIQEDHGIKALLFLYYKHVFWRWSWALGYLVLLSLSLIGLRLFSKLRAKILFTFLSTLALTGIGFLVFDNNLNNLRAAIGSFTFFTAFFTLLVVVVKSLKKEVLPYYETFCIQWVLVGVTVFSIAGSSAGFLNIHLGQWVTLPVQLILLFQIFGQKKTKTIKNQSLLLSFFIFLTPLVILSLSVVPANPYRDRPGWTGRDTPFQEESLRGIKSSQKRVESFTDFITMAKKYVKPGDVTLAYNSIPLFYYLTQTRSYLENPWPTIQGGKAMAFYFRQKEGEELPQFLFRALTNTQSLYWGNGEMIAPHSRVSLQGVEFADNWARKNGYRILWTNQDFAILGRRNP